MAKKYRSPILLSEGEGGNLNPLNGSQSVWGESIHDIKDDISTSFVYGDDSYEEEYVVPDVVEEIAAPEEEAGE